MYICKCGCEWIELKLFFIIRFCDRYVTLCQKPFSWEDQHFTPTHLDFDAAVRLLRNCFDFEGIKKLIAHPQFSDLPLMSLIQLGGSPWMMWNDGMYSWMDAWKMYCTVSSFILCKHTFVNVPLSKAGYDKFWFARTTPNEYNCYNIIVIIQTSPAMSVISLSTASGQMMA